MASTTYRLGGQIVAVQTKVGAAGTFYYTYTDHLGNIAALGQGSGVVAGSLARFDPFGNYRTTPNTTVNPGVTNHGFTGHRMNNTGNNLGLIYMNARYYLPEIGRFISPDTIVPDPTNPQSLNRYSYVNNNPMNFTDPTGHMECSGIQGGCGYSDPVVKPSKNTPPQPLVDPIRDFYASGNQYAPGERNTSGVHNGVDLVSETTREVVAIAKGRVRVADTCTNDPCTNDTSIGANFGTGSVIIIEYPFTVIPRSIQKSIGMTSDMSLYVQYQHLKSIDVAVKPGMEVSAGMVIGEYGNTGRSYGDHLHLEVHMGPQRALGIGFVDGTYDTQSNPWHRMDLVDPNLLWNIPITAR